MSRTLSAVLPTSRALPCAGTVHVLPAGSLVPMADVPWPPTCSLCGDTRVLRSFMQDAEQGDFRNRAEKIHRKRSADQ